ncbi:hypothetical protein [Burkholderia territorii]|uniref:hypothetical protein n=1 Tax=Burkholderia territorii TaxID=1503055 RepID=UPI000756A226|nr:hypothetical protein [Burkholderia territorii]KWO62596.1 hypothetical protein WT98_30485 [Burkholderia territorii]
MSEPILSRAEVKALYSAHFANPYDLLPRHVEAFAAALESALLKKLRGESLAWMVLDCVHLKPCSVTLDREDVEGHSAEHVVPLYTLEGQS